MSDVSQNEQLLAALIDGELSSDERQNAEKLLAENPQYQKLVQSWRDQAAGIRELPKYKLDEGFAFRVMRDAIAPPVVPSPAASLVSNWKMGFAAIATLAAMLLLTLFVFPKMSGISFVASNDQVESDSESDDAAEKSDASNAKSGSNHPLPGSDVMQSMAMGDDESQDGDGHALAENSAANEAGGNDSDIGTAADLEASLNRSNKKQQVTANASPGGGMSQEMSPGGRRPGPKPKVDTAPTTNVEPANTGGSSDSQMANRMEEGMPGPNRDGGRKEAMRASRPTTPDSTASGQRSRNTEIARQNTIDQVLLINMQDRDQPLEELQEVFARNSIQLMDSELIGSKQQNANALSSQSPSGVEAVYVVTTKGKLKQAILELSTRAQISGYQVPRNEQTDSQKTKAAITADDGTAPSIDVDAGLNESVSSAQRLQSFDFSSKSDYEVKDGNDVLQDAGSEGGSEAEIAEIDKWFKLAGPDSELNRYLLLIQTSQPESSSEVPSDSATSQSLDK